MSNERIAILGVGVALAGIIVPFLRSLRSDVSKRRDDVTADVSSLRDDASNLRERIARMEGFLFGGDYADPHK